MRRCGRFEVTEQGRFAASGWPAERNKLSVYNRQVDLVECGSFPVGIIKSQVFDSIDFQIKSSFMFIISGNAPSAKYAIKTKIVDALVHTPLTVG